MATHIAIRFAAAIVGAALFIDVARAAAPEQCPPRADGVATIGQIRAQKPEWRDLDDGQVVSLLKQVYYPDMSEWEIGCAIGASAPAAAVPAPLTAAQQRQYDSCRFEATRAPTQFGVQQGMQLCRERFGR